MSTFCSRQRFSFPEYYQGIDELGQMSWFCTYKLKTLYCATESQTYSGNHFSLKSQMASFIPFGEDVVDSKIELGVAVGPNLLLSSKGL